MPRKKIPLKVIEANDAASAFKPVVPVDSERRAGRKGPSEIMYIERKAGKLTGDAHIGRVTFSKTWKTVYYQGRALQRMERGGFKSNYCDKTTGEDYWVSGPKNDGSDRRMEEGFPLRLMKMSAKNTSASSEISLIGKTKGRPNQSPIGSGRDDGNRCRLPWPGTPLRGIVLA